MNKKILMYVSVAVIAIIVLNMLAFAFRLVSALVFWIVLAVAGLYAYKVLPKLRK